jgi:hypothetical protein
LVWEAGRSDAFIPFTRQVIERKKNEEDKNMELEMEMEKEKEE